MAFRLPQFPILVAVFRSGNAPPGPPDVVCLGNLTWGRRINFHDGDTGNPPEWFPTMTLLCPTGVDIRDYKDTGGNPDTVEVPSGSGRLYEVLFNDFIGLGFPNEHMGVVLRKIVGPPIPAEDLVEQDGLTLLTDQAGVQLTTQ